MDTVSSEVASHRSLRKRTGGISTFLLLAMIVLATTGGCGKNKQSVDIEPGVEWLAAMQTRIAENIDDADTVAQLMREVDAIGAEVQAFDAATIQHYTQLLELDQDYNTTRSAFDDHFREFNVIRARHRDAILSIRFKMNGLVTPEQWKILADIDRQLFTEWQRDLEL